MPSWTVPSWTVTSRRATSSPDLFHVAVSLTNDQQDCAISLRCISLYESYQLTISRCLRPLRSKIPGSYCTKGRFSQPTRKIAVRKPGVQLSSRCSGRIRYHHVPTFLMVTKQLYAIATPTVNDSDSINLQHEWKTAYTFTKYKPGCSNSGRVEARVRRTSGVVRAYQYNSDDLPGGLVWSDCSISCTIMADEPVRKTSS
jgi:hypothetical protein